MTKAERLQAAIRADMIARRFPLYLRAPHDVRVWFHLLLWASLEDEESTYEDYCF